MPTTRRDCLRRFAFVLFGTGSTAGLSACGALIHPERVGQPRTGRLDPSVVLLDGLGLILFLVPGIIAFIVDFSTGAIYLPPEHYGLNDSPPRDSAGLLRFEGPPRRLSRAGLERELARLSGKPVRLKSGAYMARPLESTGDYSRQLAMLETRPRASEVVFRAQSE